MDRPLPKRRGRWVIPLLVSLACVAACAALVWQAWPRGVPVARADIRIASVTWGQFRDETVVRASVAPLHSVVLDAVESGRVEQVLVRDGAVVAQGQLLFRLSNTQRRLESLAREAEHAQHVSNLMNLRVALESSRAERQRRIADLGHALRLATQRHARNEALSRQGFLSAAVLEESAELVAQQRLLLQQETASSERAELTQGDAIRQMEQAGKRLSDGLHLVQAGVDALAVRAPAAGRLTDFHLQVGETVRPDQHLGRIDDASRFKLTAMVDEFYLNRVAAGQSALAVIAGRDFPLTVARSYPQIRDGRFVIELEFTGSAPVALSPGQGIEVRITLGHARQALLLPNEAFAAEGSGAHAFVLSADGRMAEPRAVKFGRRTPAQLEVLDGLAPGERVVVSSYVRFRNAQRLELID